jgi:hypothetical protein
MSKNPHTGDELKSRINSKEFEDNYDRIFRSEPKENLCRICGKNLPDVQECAWNSCPKLYED